MSVQFRKAIRTETSLLIGLAGPSGGGKTKSALRLASGLVQGTDKRIVVIDTEAGRALHYADEFDFDHTELLPPFRPQTYTEAVVAADKAGYGVIIVDSTSHEYEGEGGILEWADEIIEKGGTWSNGQPKVKPPSQWKEPKMAHKRFMNRMLQCRAHLIFCLRAEEKMLMETVEENGKKKTLVVAAKDRPLKERWQPICEKRFMYEMTASFLLLDGQPGIPVPIKLQDQHKPAFPEGSHINENAGVVLAQWAHGGAKRASGGDEPPASEEDTTTQDQGPRYCIQKNSGVVNCEGIDDWKNKMLQAVSAITDKGKLQQFRQINGAWMAELSHHHSDEVMEVQDAFSEALQ